jgi:hypothetical protein
VTDLQGAWVFDVFIIVVMSVFNAVFQAFALHSAMAAKAVHAPEIAGLKLIAYWAPCTAAWLAVGIGVGLLKPGSCGSADSSMLWLGVAYLVTAWPAIHLGNKVGVRLPGWYWGGQIAIATILALVGGTPCLVG